MLLAAAAPARAEEDTDQDMLGLYYEPRDLEISSATRTPTPLSQNAENISVITAEEIEAMNAHTLADVLMTVPGVQVSGNTAPGAAASFVLAGASTRHILVLVDGVTINDQLDNFALIGQIPVQNIERVEIVKGPGSSAWGSALGGVISVVTKEPSKTAPVGGSAVGTWGWNGTRDARGELSGTVGRLGYYLSGGHLKSNGFRDFNATENNNLYAKLRWDIPDRGSIRLTFNYLNTLPQEGLFKGPIFDPLANSSRFTNRQIQSTLSFDYGLTDQLTLSGLLKATRLDYNQYRDLLDTGERLGTVTNDEKTGGGALLLTWRQGTHTLTGGMEYERAQSDTNVNYPLFDYNQQISASNDKYGLFINDTIAWKRLTITPAFRYDLTSHSGDHFSPSVGATFNLTDRTLLRAFVARGYSLPILTPDASKEKGWTLQAGLETTEIPFLWLKGTWFRNYIQSNGQELGEDLTEGFELEARTTPVYNTWLSAGYVFMDVKDLKTYEIIKNTPRYTWDLGLHYDDHRLFRGALTGHYIWWNADSIFNAQYKDFIWDLNLGWRFYKNRDTESELFFTGHNLFNGKQYNLDVLSNPHRWFEFGLRLKF